MNRACCVILARGGSKRIPGKNIRPFNGLPMLAWPIRAALSARLFSRVFISTDSAEIEAVARAHGATSLGLRDASLADDHATTAQVLSDFLAELANGQALPESLCCLYGTSVFATADLIRQGAERLKAGQADLILAVSPYPHPPERALVADGTGRVTYAFPDSADVRTQDFPPAFYDLGLFYWMRTAPLLRRATPGFAPLTMGAVTLPRSYAVDMDWPEDIPLAEMLHRHHCIRPSAEGCTGCCRA